jgi:uncharacterized phage protein gp47/JayE
MYEDYTVETIKNYIIGRLSTDINTSEGSYTNDMVSAVAYEIWKYYQALNAIVPIAYVDETSGEYIDKRCAEYGITRKSGAKATTTLTLTGTDNTTIEAGKVFLTSDGLQFETTKTVVIQNGTATIIATAAGVGSDYNVAPGTMLYQLVTISGLKSVTNTAATGGADEETDEALVARLYDYLKNPTTSGNISHYRKWALAVNGVGAAKVTPLWNGAGTVKILIAGSDNGPVDSDIVSKCAAYIEANRPIGATVTVGSAKGLKINVSAKVQIDSITTLAKAQEAFSSALEKYLKGISFSKYTLVYNRIAAMLLDIDGVIDFTTLTVNGGIANIAIEPDQVPVIGTVEVTIS